MNIYQRKLLELIRDGKLNNLTRKETAAEIGLKYPGHVFYHLTRLQTQGFIRFGVKNEVFLNPKTTGGRASFWQIPVLGTAACGDATAFAEGTVEDHEMISTRFAAENSGFFAVRAFGDSMNKANINGQNIEEGDLAIIDPNKQVPTNGDYVLSVIDGLANIKRFYRDASGQVMLKPESTNETHKVITLHPEDPISYVVAGTVRHVIKNRI